MNHDLGMATARINVALLEQMSPVQVDAAPATVEQTARTEQDAGVREFYEEQAAGLRKYAARRRTEDS